MAVTGGRAGGRSGGRIGSGSWRWALCAAIGVSLGVPGAVPSLAAQLHGQHWDVTPETARGTVGDTITVHFRIRLDERDLLFDTVPRPAVTPPDWVRVLSVDKLDRQPDRIFVGRARIAFYRPGRQQVPIFQLPFMRSVKGLSRGTLVSDSAAVEIVPVLQAGSSATLRDIKEPREPRAPNPLELLLGLAALGVAGWLAWRTRRAPTAVIPAPSAAPPAPAPPPDPYALALARLDAIVREAWAARDVAQHYEAVADVLRDYLEAQGVPARELTTTELRWAMPPALMTGSGRRFAEVFEAADLVKFAHWRPGVAQAEGFVRAAEELLRRWHRAHSPEAEARAENVVP